jgi:peptidoglycan hydrolase-like protein with peptidoglycan-binding domain
MSKRIVSTGFVLGLALAAVGNSPAATAPPVVGAGAAAKPPATSTTTTTTSTPATTTTTTPATTSVTSTPVTPTSNTTSSSTTTTSSGVSSTTTVTTTPGNGTATLPPPPPANVTIPATSEGVPPTPAPAFPGLPAPGSTPVSPGSLGPTRRDVEDLRPVANLQGPVSVSQVQTALAQSGFYRGPIDGQLAAPTLAAVRAFQSANGLPATGLLDAQTVAALGVVVFAPVPQAPSGLAGAVSPSANGNATATTMTPTATTPTTTTTTTTTPMAMGGAPLASGTTATPTTVPATGTVGTPVIPAPGTVATPPTALSVPREPFPITVPQHVTSSEPFPISEQLRNPLFIQP